MTTLERHPGWTRAKVGCHWTRGHYTVSTVSNGTRAGYMLVRNFATLVDFSPSFEACDKTSREHEAYLGAVEYWRNTLGSSRVALLYWRLHASRAAKEGSTWTGQKFRMAATFAREVDESRLGVDLPWKDLRD